MIDSAMKRWAEAQTSVGEILTQDARRDAIHFAVAPVVAADDIRAGGHVGLLPDGRASCGVATQIGIADPFLPRDIKAGERFWLFLYPNTITTLRHVWEHPAFTNEVTPQEPANLAEARKRVEDFLAGADCALDCDEFIRVMRGETICRRDDDEYPTRIYRRDEYIHHSNTDAHGDIPGDIWPHVEVLMGHPIKDRPEGFSCSC